MKILAAFLTVALVAAGAGTLLNRQGGPAQAVAATPAPAPAENTAAKGGAWMWQDRKGTGLDAKKVAPVSSGARAGDENARYTWSRMPDGTWVQHDDRFSAMETYGLGRKR